MATTRCLRSLRPISSAVSSPSSSLSTARCLTISTLNMNHGDKVTSGADAERRRIMAATVKAAAAAATSETVETNTEMFDLSSLLANVRSAILIPLRTAARKKIWKQHIQNLIEKLIIDCRFFTLFAVVGTLLGSILCYVEGGFIVAESYLQYFQRSDKGHLVELLIEAIDMFLVGTALMVFGVGLYAMFVGARAVEERSRRISGSNLFGLFYMKKLPTWVEMKSMSQAKSKIGHAVTMILQVGVLEKFNSVPLVSAADLACFAGAVLVSSASVFFLARLKGDGGAGFK